MPKVTTIRGCYRDENNNPVEVVEDATVSIDGRFSVGIPPELEAFAQQLFWKEGNKHPLARVNLDGRRNERLRVFGMVLAEVSEAFDFILKTYSTPVVTKELVILYLIVGRASAWRNADGSLSPSGAHAPTGSVGWVKMRERIDPTHPINSFGVDVSASVRVRVTKTRGTHVVTTYEIADDSIRREWVERGAPFEPGSLLSRWVCVRPAGPHVAAMPYTPEAEAFFDKAMERVQALAVQFEEFGANAEKVAAAIAGNGPALLGMEAKWMSPAKGPSDAT